MISEGRPEAPGHSEAGEAVKAVCVLTNGSKLSAEEVRQYVGEQIAGFKKPRQVIFVQELPYDNNQIDRDAVKAKWGG